MLLRNSFRLGRVKCFLSSAIIVLAFSSKAYSQFSTLQLAEDYFSRAQFDYAIEKYREIEKNSFAQPVDKAFSQCRIGMILSIKNSQTEAKNYLEQAMASGLIPKRITGVCQYALLQIYILGKDYAIAKKLLQKNEDPDLKPIYLARVYALGVEIGQNLHDNKLTIIYLQKLLSVMENNALTEVEIKILDNKKFTLKEVRERLGFETKATMSGKDTLAKNTGIPQVVKTSTPIPTPATPQPVVVTPKNAIAMSVQHANNSSGQQSFKPSLPELSILEILQNSSIGSEGPTAKLASLLGQGPQLEKALIALGISIPAERIVARLSKTLVDSPTVMRVGIILPAGGFYTKFNYRILRAISSFASSSATKGVDFSFSVKIVENDIGQIEKAALDLILGDAVHGIVGPISNSQTLGVVGLAHLFSVPVMALGPVVGAEELHFTNLVRMGSNAKSQAQVMVKHLQTDAKLRNVSILAPDDPYGYEMAKSFEGVAKEMTFPIVQSIYYSAVSEQFSNVVQTAIGPQDAAARKEEYENMLKEAKKKAQEEKRKFDPKKVILPPILPFDVLYIPDSLIKARMIISTFAFLGAEKVKYAGDKQWSEGAVGKKSIADPFMNGSRVTTPDTGAFLSYLRKDIAVFDGSLDLERQAFDALIFLRTAQFYAKGNSGKKLIDVWHAKDWGAEGTKKYGPVEANGEPFCKYVLQAYHNGKLEDELPEWKLDEEVKATPIPHDPLSKE